MSNALDATHLTKRYGHTWALRDCSVTVPTARIAALVGPNGAGKTTLLHLAVGLLKPTSGEIAVFGHSPISEPLDVLRRTGFVAQDHPLYRGFTIAETLHTCRVLNAEWDDAFARARLDHLSIPLNRGIGQLSGGQQAQVALVLALAKQPDLLLLDEPLASLDPLARRNFLRVTLDAATERGTTVLLSSHIISDLERACDYLIVLTGGGVRLMGDIETIVAEHKFLISSATTIDAVAHQHTIIEAVHMPRQTMLLVRLNGPLFDTSWDVQPASLEDIVLAYFGQAAENKPSPAIVAQEAQK